MLPSASVWYSEEGGQRKGCPYLVSPASPDDIEIVRRLGRDAGFHELRSCIFDLHKSGSDCTFLRWLLTSLKNDPCAVERVWDSLYPEFPETDLRPREDVVANEPVAGQVMSSIFTRGLVESVEVKVRVVEPCAMRIAPLAPCSDLRRFRA